MIAKTVVYCFVFGLLLISWFNWGPFGSVAAMIGAVLLLIATLVTIFDIWLTKHDGHTAKTKKR